MSISEIFNPDLLYFCYILLGYAVFSVIIWILRWLCAKTSNKIDDKFVSILEKWHKKNKERIHK